MTKREQACEEYQQRGWVRLCLYLTFAWLAGAHVVFKITTPRKTHLADDVSFGDVTGRRLTIAVIAPDSEYAIEAGPGVKVIAGSWTCSV